jgi:hypothetical protein
MLGEALEPVRPVLAAAEQAGAVSAEKVAIIQRAVATVDRRASTRPPSPGENNCSPSLPRCSRRRT